MNGVRSGGIDRAKQGYERLCNPRKSVIAAESLSAVRECPAWEGEQLLLCH